LLPQRQLQYFSASKRKPLCINLFNYEEGKGFAPLVICQESCLSFDGEQRLSISSNQFQSICLESIELVFLERQNLETSYLLAIDF
ncbi:MAG: hypothetical protein AAGJ95_04460, partial [Cyanobacteria bacterium J06554_11]